MSGKSLWVYYLILPSLAGCAALADIPLLRKQPFGVAMCKHLCQRVFGCEVLKYIQLNLSCQIGDIHYQARTRTQGINIFKIPKAEKTTKNCLPAGILLKSRAQAFQCVKTKRRHKNLFPKDSPLTGTYYLNMTSVTYEICQKLYQLCACGNKWEAKSQLLKLCAESIDITTKNLSPLDEFVLKNGCNLSRLGLGNATILHKASQLGLLNVVKCVLSKQQVSIESRNMFGWTPIMRAAGKARVDVFRLLLNVGSDLSTVDIDGNSILHFSCRGGSLTIVKDIFMEGYGNIHCRTKEGFTPTMTAVQYCQKAIFKYLLHKGSNVSEVTNTGSNLLHIASSFCSGSFVKYILDNKIADVDSRDYRGRTPLMMAVQCCHESAFEILLAKGSNLLQVTHTGSNLLHIASSFCGESFVKYIVDNKIADVESRDYKRRTPIMMAAKHFRRTAFHYLLKHKARLQVEDRDGNNLLHMACMGGNAEITKSVLKYMTKDALRKKNKWGKTPWDLAKKKKGNRVLLSIFRRYQQVSFRNLP